MDSSVLQLKVTLGEVEPPVWRRSLVPRRCNLYTLHRIIQALMPWEERDLWLFEVNGVEYGDLRIDDAGVKVARNRRLGETLRRPGDSLRYEYDFGDGWSHVIELESILPEEPGFAYPICLDGARACPPEDCGGPLGYQDLLEALEDPHHPDHAWRLEWLGRPFDPEAFDREYLNFILRLSNFFRTPGTRNAR